MMKDDRSSDNSLCRGTHVLNALRTAERRVSEQAIHLQGESLL